ncbi:uncharacterized protein [Gossypium hirsutum]|uniref:Reverse transcriptase n=1 Tax=Gossypium hirsutum TaxID=3635 RepID=A0A1U8NW64_GOSHI|nr:uncharacterized protein LOC107952461 [Gossypium hirsutum]
MNEEQLKFEVVNFYKALYGEHPGSMRGLPLSAFPPLSDEDFILLNSPISDEEIKVALFDMAPLKVPESDGFYAISTKVSGITLAPPFAVGLRVIANHFKMVFPKFIALEQAGFLVGQNMTDNIFITQEVIHSMRRTQKKRMWMAIKIDLEKAYDRVHWDFIDLSLQAAGVVEWGSNFEVSTYQRRSKSTGNWIPIRLACNGPPLSHLLFADDLILFGHAGEHQFEEAYQQFLWFSRSEELGTYLGVPFFHERVTNNMLRFMVDKTMMLPKGLYDETERIVRKFVWVSTNGNIKVALVTWDSVCQPKSYGGLGLKQLKDHNTSFMMKMGFDIISNINALWVWVLRSKYGIPSGLPENVSRGRCSFLWKSIAKVWPLICENLS